MVLRPGLFAALAVAAQAQGAVRVRVADTLWLLDPFRTMRWWPACGR